MQLSHRQLQIADLTSYFKAGLKLITECYNCWARFAQFSDLSERLPIFNHSPGSDFPQISLN